MGYWKADPLFGRLFEEIGALWGEIPEEVRPALFRVEQRTDASWNSNGNGRLLNTWIFDDHGTRLASVLKRETHEFGETRDGFSRYGLVWFSIADGRDRVVLNYRLGPAIGGQIEYEVEGEGDAVELFAGSGTLA